MTSTNHGRPRTRRPTGFGRRIPRPSDTASRSRTCASQTAPRLRALTECFRRRIQDHQRIRWARNWIKPLTTSTTALSQQHRRRAHHERELAKKETNPPTSTTTSTSQWQRDQDSTCDSELGKLVGARTNNHSTTRSIPDTAVYPNYKCTAVLIVCSQATYSRIRIQFQWNQWKQHASAARDLAKSGQGSGRAASTAVACSRCIKVESGTF